MFTLLSESPRLIEQILVCRMVRCLVGCRRQKEDVEGRRNIKTNKVPQNFRGLLVP